MNFSRIRSSIEKISLINGIISLSLTNPAPVGIEMFDVRGNLLKKAFERSASAGDYQFDVTKDPLSANLILIRVSIGQQSSTFRYAPLKKGNTKVASPIAISLTGRTGLAKKAATVDTLEASASGYISNNVAVSSYQGVVNITLDSMALAKFSFFVASLKALVELSKSSNGFGGDLRFGKTGQGAGLLGADSICQRIAEKSMPGSKVKIWRAFLSAAKGPNGQQVNAIERIGQGPWYDRLGRIVSPDIKGLLSARPMRR